MFCTKCGRKDAENNKFCTRCGNKLDESAQTVEKGSGKKESMNSNEQVWAGMYMLSEAKRAANKTILWGIFWIVLGLVITAISYASTEPGDTYTIW